MHGTFSLYCPQTNNFMYFRTIYVILHFHNVSLSKQCGTSLSRLYEIKVADANCEVPSDHYIEQFS